MSDAHEARLHLQAAMSALEQDPISRANEIIRSDELSRQKGGVWAHIRQVAGGFWVTCSFDPVELAPNIWRSPDSPHQEFAADSLSEVVSILESRFGGA